MFSLSERIVHACVSYLWCLELRTLVLFQGVLALLMHTSLIWGPLSWSLSVKWVAVRYMNVATAYPGGRRRTMLVVLALFVLLVVACSPDETEEVDDGLLWTIDNAVSVGFEKTEQLSPDRAKVLDAWKGTFNGAVVDLYRHRVTELGVDVPADPTWLHGQTLADDCCNMWQRNRLTAVCATQEQACKDLREALQVAFPI